MKRSIFLMCGLVLVVVMAPPICSGPSPQSSVSGKRLPTVFTEEMTWVEVRDALKAGKTTVIVPTGGIEQNGPYLVTGKHNYIVHATAEAIARKLGNALVAPVVPFVPEGDIDPPTGHMEYPGTIGVTDRTFRLLLTDICSCYRTHGFLDIVLIGDHGWNQDGMKDTAKRLNRAWAGGKTRVHFIPEYYDAEGLDDWLAQHGIHEKDEGVHDYYAVSAMLAAVDPKLIRMDPRRAAGKFSINGVNLDPIEKTADMGHKLIAWYTDVAVRAIEKSLAKGR